MMRLREIFLFVCLALILATEAHALQCDGGIVSTKDKDRQAIKKCGDPVWKRAWQEDVIERLDKNSAVRKTVAYQEWLYNFGPDRFMHLLTFREKRLVKIEIRGYGFEPGHSIDNQCNNRIVEVGDLAGEVLLKCGHPIDRAERQIELTERIDDDLHRQVSLLQERWTYNFGSGRFKRVLIFRNARLVDIKMGKALD